MTYHNSLQRVTTTRRSDLWQLAVASFHIDISSLYLTTYKDPFRHALEIHPRRAKDVRKRAFQVLLLKKQLYFHIFVKFDT